MARSDLNLREIILGEPACSALLGTYSLPGGQTVPAIAVGGRYPPAGTTATGLEIAILPDGVADISPCLNLVNLWGLTTELVLKQWEPSGSTLPMAMMLAPLLQEWGTVDVRPAVLPLQSLSNIETRRIRFTESLLYRR